MTSGRAFPDLGSLHERHYGITPELGAAYAQAASVCLDRHHTPPVVLTVGLNAEPQVSYTARWTPAQARALHAWENQDDATRDGAYCVTLAAAEVHLGLVAYQRTVVGSGADYLVAPPVTSDPEDVNVNFEMAYRLEISGIDRCKSDAELQYRVRQKVAQAQAGRSSLPALAGVVAFNLLRIVFREVA